MGGVWAAIAVLFVIVIVVGGILINNMSNKNRKDHRDELFRRELLKIESRKEAARLRDKDSPEIYIAEREAQRVRERYLAGEDSPV